jgi:glycosyltransferase involved in cell wall biosynthesis
MCIAISVIICTHNPRPDYLNRVLIALRNQTLPLDGWELLVIDNASKVPIAGRFDISWHLNGRHIHEPTLGKTVAVLRGISNARAELFLFVDDDNVLVADYLVRALQIGRDYPFLGAFGSGLIRPEFEVEPPAWAKPHLDLLSLLELDRDVWSNLIHEFATVPWGAGLVVRSHVARTYAAHCEKSDIRLNLDRKGDSLISAGDCDLALTACDLGLGTGRFVRLSLTHLIPSRRLRLGYLTRMAEEMRISTQILMSLRGGTVTQPQPQRLLARLNTFFHRMRLSREERAIYDANMRGIDKGAKLIANRDTKPTR